MIGCTALAAEPSLSLVSTQLADSTQWLATERSSPPDLITHDTLSLIEIVLAEHFFSPVCTELSWRRDAHLHPVCIHLAVVGVAFP